MAELSRTRCEEIQDALAPIIARHGILSVTRALADRIASDAHWLPIRHKGPGAEAISLDLDCLAGMIREAVEDYERRNPR